MRGTVPWLAVYPTLETKLITCYKLGQIITNSQERNEVKNVLMNMVEVLLDFFWNNIVTTVVAVYDKWKNQIQIKINSAMLVCN